MIFLRKIGNTICYLKADLRLAALRAEKFSLILYICKSIKNAVWNVNKHTSNGDGLKAVGKPSETQC